MKHFAILLLLLLSVQRGHSQTSPAPAPKPESKKPDSTAIKLDSTSTKQLQEIDAQLSNPLSRSLITGAAYNRLVYKSQVAIGGSGIKEGKIIGANATVDDKGATLNISTSPFKRKDKSKPPRIALVATVKGTAEEGVVSLFSGRDYRKTLGFGGSGLFFLPWGRFTYNERTKKNLQEAYRKIRAKEKTAWKDSYKPKMRPTWKDSSRLAVALFSDRWDTLQTKNWASSYYANKLLDTAVINNAQNRAFMARYVEAEHAVLTLLPKDWDSEYETAELEKGWLAKFRHSVTQKADTAKMRDSVKVWWNRESEKMRAASVKRYDSLQDSARWEGLQFHWLSVGGLFNTVRQPVFDAQARSAGFAGKVRDDYWSGQIAYNWLRAGKKTNLYLTGGVSAAKQRTFKPTDLKTYETVSWQRTGTDSVRVVEQKKLYPMDPGQKLVTSLQVGGTVFFHEIATKFGLEARYAHELAGPEKRNFTFGIFAPVQAASTSVILMPLVRWENQGEPEEWTVGVSLTTSIPTFVKPKDTK